MGAHLSSDGDLLRFAHPILISMANRPRRLADSLDELSRLAGRPIAVGAELHVVRPAQFADAGGFISPGYRSNTHAHLQAAQWARASGRDRVLVLEDDVAFGAPWADHGRFLIEQLSERPWHLANLGYLDEWGEGPTVGDGPWAVDGVGWARFSGRVNGAHAYLLHGSVLDDWIDHLEAVLSGEPGDELRGPMASDGAINTFFWIDPERVRLLAVPNLAGTRPTRSDLDPGRLDRLPVVAPGVEWLRRRYRRWRPGRSVNYR